MKDKTPRSAGKSELVKLLAQRDLRIEALEKTVSELRKCNSQNALSSKSVMNAGSIAEASLQISNIFSAAQESADRYLDSIREMEKNAVLETERIISDARSEAKAMLEAAEQECAAREAEEKANIDLLWADLQTKLLDFYEHYSELSELFEKLNFTQK